MPEPRDRALHSGPLLRLPSVLAALAVAALALAPARGAGEQGPPTFEERLAVREVTLELHATDSRGLRVEDLRPEELEVLQDGRPVRLLSLRWVGEGQDSAPGTSPGAGRATQAASPEAARVPAAATPAPPLRLALFVDNVHIGPATRARTLGQLWSFLSAHLRPADELMVAVYDGSLRVLQPFTADRSKALQALADAEQSAINRLAAGSEELRLMELAHEIQRTEVAAMHFGPRGDPCVMLEILARSNAASRHHEVVRMLEAATRLVAAVAGLPGSKAILHVSDGVPLIPGLAPLEMALELCDGTGAAQGLTAGIDLTGDPHDHLDPNRVRGEIARLDTTRRWQELAARANLARVTFLPFQASGAETPGGVSAAHSARIATPTTFAAELRNRQDSLVLVAEETGGRALLDANRLEPALAPVMAELRSYYELSFEPPEPVRGQIHRLEVRTSRPGVRLRHRRSYRVATREDEMVDAVTAALLHESESNALGARLDAAVEGEGEPRQLRLRLEIPLAALTLAPEGAGARALFTVFVAAEDRHGNRTGVRHATRAVAVGAEQLPNPRGHFTYEVTLPLSGPSMVVAVGVLDELGGGSTVLRRRVP